MDKATLYTDNIYGNNRIFDENESYCMYLLKEKLKEHNIDIGTQDINPTADSKYIIYMDMPINFEELKNIGLFDRKKHYLLILENEMIRPDDWDTTNHQYFDKIFTWNDDFVDNKLYFKINSSFKVPEDLHFDIKSKDKFCNIIAGNKSDSHLMELYSERKRAIRWFEQNHPEDFDLYGICWNEYHFNIPFSMLNNIKFLTKLLAEKYPSYRGSIKSKIDVLKRYKFSICYENAQGFTGYISEKIMDCFFSGCVPIYLGAPNVKDHIPSNTFIDKRDFSTYE